jgi:hypothetical protein
MGICVPVETVCGRDASNSDNVLTNNLSTGLDAPEKLPTLMIVQGFFNLILQNGARMVAATLCSHIQLADGIWDRKSSHIYERIL